MLKVTYQPKQVRIFLVLLLILAIALTFKLTRHGAVLPRSLALAAEAVIIGMLLVFPRVFFPAFRAIMIASSFIGNFIFALISTVVFFLILTPIALAMKISGKKFMDTDPEPSLPSYYCETEEQHNITKQY
jgi:hypothetical protein